MFIDVGRRVYLVKRISNQLYEWHFHWRFRNSSEWFHVFRAFFRREGRSAYHFWKCSSVSQRQKGRGEARVAVFVAAVNMNKKTCAGARLQDSPSDHKLEQSVAWSRQGLGCQQKNSHRSVQEELNTETSVLHDWRCSRNCLLEHF